MKGLLSLFAVAAAMSAAPPAQAQDGAAAFRPVGTWTIDYGDDYCRLIRTFSDGQREFSLALERLQPGAMVRLIVVGEVMRPLGRGPRHRAADYIGYAFDPAGSSGQARYVLSETADGRSFVSLDPIVLAAPPTPDTPQTYDRAIEQEAARGVTGFTLSEGLTSPVRVETGSLGEPIEALQVCADNLLTAWGLDAEKHRTMTVPPIMNPNRNRVLPPGTISYNKLRNLGGGTNQVRLMIATDGKVTGCAIHSPSLPQSLNERICNFATERASFDPARDSAGQAMASVWIGSPLDLDPWPTIASRDSGPGSSATGPAFGLASPPSSAVQTIWPGSAVVP
jgi:hypothetical protein